MRDVRRALRALAELEPGELPVLSVYLDMRPHATGESPALRAGTVILKNRLRPIEKTFLPRGLELESIRADAERIDRYLEDEYDVAADGLALFACAGRGLFEGIEAGVPFENQVTVAPQPDLFQLARLVDEHETPGRADGGNRGGGGGPRQPATPGRGRGAPALQPRLMGTRSEPVR